MADAALLVYLKAFVVLLVIWRILTIGIFGQVVGGVLSATLAYCLSRRSNAVPQQMRDISAPLYDLKKSPHMKLAASLIIDILSTRYVPTPALFTLLVGQADPTPVDYEKLLLEACKGLSSYDFAGFVPIGTFLVQYLYDRPALTAIDIVKARLPFANYVPSCTIGWLIENNVIKQEWIGGSQGPFLKV